VSELHLSETKHPDKLATQRYEALAGLDAQKQELLDELILLLDGHRLAAWCRKHHSRGLPVIDAAERRAPLVLLSGEVGCGKTALATSIASPLAEHLDKRVICLETPSNIRGSGRVGEISARITDAFAQARSKVEHAGPGLLVIDEGDDLATSRAQMQAHHEDRAGLNVLIKEIDRLARERVPLVVLLVTNRASVLDPALTRRAALHLRFDRPAADVRRAIFERVLAGTKHRKEDIGALVERSARAPVPYSSSDLAVRLTHAALRKAWREDRPFGPEVLREVLDELEPSPLVGEAPSRA
jgi:SpoVK/Ycf46/Vps4 family AAA+-type ATPase